MKTISKLVYLCTAILAAALSLSAAAPKWQLCFEVGSVLREKIARTAATLHNPAQLVTVEGQSSYTYAEVNGLGNYFLIPTVAAQGGRLLRMDPFFDSDQTYTYGILNTEVVFTDVITEEVFRAPLVRLVDANGSITSRATFVVDNKQIFVLVGYSLSIRYPVAMLTWGSGAAYGEEGIDVDNFGCVNSISLTTNKIVDVHALFDESGTYGAFLSLDQPLHANHHIEKSHDLNVWARIDLKDLMVSVDGRKVFYQSSGKKEEFFRVVVD